MKERIEKHRIALRKILQHKIVQHFIVPIFRKLDTGLNLALGDGAKIMFLVFSGAVLLLCLAYQLPAIAHPYSLDYGEAPLVDQAMRLAAGQNIYRPDISTPPYTISNYPPLYVVVLAVSVKLFGPSLTFHIGRLLSALCAWAVSIFLALIIYRTTRDRFAALVAGSIFLAFPFVMYWSPFLRIDMFALALSVSGLYVLVADSNSWRSLILGAFLLVAAIYTRQSYALAAPMAAFCWLLLSRNWRCAFVLAALVGGVGLALFLLLNGLTHGGFYYNIVTANVNEFGLDRLLDNWDRFREATLILLLFGGFSIFLIWRWNPLWTLAVPYLVGGALSAVTIGKIGSNVNYLLELCAALSLAAGIVIAWSRKFSPVFSLQPVFLILLAWAIGGMLHIFMRDSAPDLKNRRTSLSQLSQLDALVGKTPGSILADEYMGMLTLQGRPLVIQPFEVTQLAREGHWDQTPLLDRIHNKEFAAIIIYEPWSGERWTPEMREAINQSYILADIIAENKVYMALQHKVSPNISACPGAKWQLPGDGSLGVKLKDGGMDFFGQGKAGQIPVYAVADGLLMRLPDWWDAVAIQHDDPLHPGEKVWTYYSSMGSANGTDSYVAQDFPAGAANIPVKAGQLLGCQGSWNGRPGWASWAHVHFAVIRAGGQGVFPSEWTVSEMLDPVLYLNLALDPQLANRNLQPLLCVQP
jgi:MFS family permease